MYLFKGNIILVLIPSTLMGIFLSPTLTIGVELASEIGYPVGEAYSNGMIQIFGNITGVLFSEFIPMLLVKNNEGRTYITLLIVFIISGIGFVCLIIMKEKLNRAESEKLLGGKQDVMLNL